MDHERDEFSIVLADVLWVMNQMIQSHHPTKRAHEDVDSRGEGGRLSKR